MTTKINILIQGESCIAQLVPFRKGSLTSWTIQQDMGGINSVRLSLAGEQFFAACRPPAPSDDRFGELDIRVIIGDVAYDFLIEERSTTYSPDGLTFQVWGRSKQALLTTKYAPNVSDTDDTAHPWQTGNTTAVEAIAHVLTEYGGDAVAVGWTPEDYPIYQGTLNVSNQAPIDFIRMLAEEIGADVRGEIDGSLSVIPYEITGVHIESYNDLDDIVALSEDVEAPQGYNAVTIYGYGTGPFDEREEEEGDDDAGEDPEPGEGWISLGSYDGEIAYPDAQTIRIYYWHSQGARPVIWREDVDMIVAGLWSEGHIYSQTSEYYGRTFPTETILETVELTWGAGRKFMTPTNGDTVVVGDENIPFQSLDVEYEVNYLDARFENMQQGEEYRISVLFEDKSAEAKAQWTVGPPVEPVEPVEPVDVPLIAFNHHTDARVEGVQVYVDGVYIGDTDADGMVIAYGLEPGDHSVLFDGHAGFVPSDEDDLPNDDFRVS
jgi:hypothetical protein